MTSNRQFHLLPKVCNIWSLKVFRTH